MAARRISCWTMALAVLCVGLCASSSARAAEPTSPSARAERLFKEGSEALERGRYDEACSKLAESESITVALGTEFNLGVCLELTHKPASAKRAFLLAANLAKQAGKESLAKDASTRAKKMDLATPRLVIRAPSDAGPTLAVKCDGKLAEKAAADPNESSGSEPRPKYVLELDPGSHRVEATSEGRPPFSATVDLAESRTTEITIAFGASSAVQTSKPTGDRGKTPPPREPEGPPWKVIGLGVLGVGVVTLGVATYFGLSAKSGLDDSGCRDGRVCPDQASLDRLNDAHRDADVSTVLVVIGGVLAGGGAALFFAAPQGSAAQKGGLRVQPAASPSQATLTLSTHW